MAYRRADGHWQRGGLRGHAAVAGLLDGVVHDHAQPLDVLHARRQVEAQLRRTAQARVLAGREGHAELELRGVDDVTHLHLHQGIMRRQVSVSFVL